MKDCLVAVFFSSTVFQLRKYESISHSEKPFATFYYQHISNLKTRAKQTHLVSAQLIQRVHFYFLVIYSEIYLSNKPWLC